MYHVVTSSPQKQKELTFFDLFQLFQVPGAAAARLCCPFLKVANVIYLLAAVLEVLQAAK